MQAASQTHKIGKRAVSALAACIVLWAALGVSPRAACAADKKVKFTAELDRTDISQDDSVSLKFTVQADGNVSVQNIEYDAPDFEVINEYPGTYVESYYDNGHFGMRYTQQLTKVLRPKRQGLFRITHIRAHANGMMFAAPDLTVRVGPPGAGTPPPQQRGYGGGGAGLRGVGRGGSDVILRAELDKSRAYKGEQVVVSYYLYRRVQMFGISVDKWPVLTGFLREDLEVPVMSPRLDTERVVLNGGVYERSLLARYAAYPLQEGKLKIDSMTLKYNYYSHGGGGGGGDDDDPFMALFQQMAPHQGTARSEQVTVDVVPLPADGKPASFSGGVGDFTMSSAVDKYDVHANEALSLTVKIEGRGNVAAIGEPKAKWPDNVELYDSKGVAKTGKGGVGEKDFTFLLIPRVPGKLVLPPLEFSYFDPVRHHYVTRTTDPISINVLDPLAGTAVEPRPQGGAVTQAAAPGETPAAAETPMPLKPPEVEGLSRESAPGGIAFWHWLYWLSLVAFAVFAALVSVDLLRKLRNNAAARRNSRERAKAKSWERLRGIAQAARKGAAWNEVLQGYELLTGVVLDTVDRAYGVGARGHSRSDLKEMLVVQRGMPEETWHRLAKLLEFAETARFASSAGAVPEGIVRGDLEKWVAEGENLAGGIARAQKQSEGLHSTSS